MESKFLTNYTEKTFLDKLRESIDMCKTFSFSVSFIKKAGLQLIEQNLENALRRGAKGRIITSTYQNFTDIASLNTFNKWMNEYNNFECHLDFSKSDEKGFHSKGYLFEFDDHFEFLVGSTNITRFALMKNVEWNVSLSSKDKFQSISDAYKEFDLLWNKSLFLSTEIINKYKSILEYAIEKWDMDYIEPSTSRKKPNSMQREALKQLKRYRDLGAKRALVVSATGSGKTYLSAFDARSFDAKRVLFVAHRDKILGDARKTFIDVFGVNVTCGLYVGKYKEIDNDFLFASNIMLSEHLDDFDKNEFDYIVLDECHHAAANTYKKIIEYFNPEFLLGMTATPERMDDQDIFSMFDMNVPFELRLRDAINNDLIVPFHYYGIKDKLIDYQFKEKNKISKEISKEENIDFIKQEIEKHLPDGKIKAIAFCVDKAHCQRMADAFESVGFNAVSLNGDNNYGERIKAFMDLQDDNNPLQIICTVDILNEGVDIPSINMVYFLRPTESSTIFIQQLGRGLRKYEGKQYLTVLDFIGNNYDRSIHMAMALGSLGQTTIMEKPYLIELLRDNFKSLDIPGVVIDIDELSREEVVNYLKEKSFNTFDFLKKDYQNFKSFLKKDSIPTHMDYLNTDCAPDLMRLMKAKVKNLKSKSYYSFLKAIGEENLDFLTDKQISFVDNLSELLPIVRVDEIIIINQLLTGTIKLNALIGYNKNVSIKTLENALFHLKKDKLVTKENKLNIDGTSECFVNYMNDLIEYALTRYEEEFGEFDGKFKLYGNYTKEQIQKVRLKETTMFMKGTEFPNDDFTYLYVGLNKTGDKLKNLNYKDKFINPKVFQWESEKDVSWDNSIGKKLANTEKVYLFIRKKTEEDGITLPFTYFGLGKLTNSRESNVEALDEDGNIVIHDTLLFDVELENEVPKKYWFDFEIPEKEDKNE